MRTEEVLAIPLNVFKKNYSWMKEYPVVTIRFQGNREEKFLELPFWKADRILSGCGINTGILHFKRTTADPMVFYADVDRYEDLKKKFITLCGASNTDEEAERLQQELLRNNEKIAQMNLGSNWIDNDELERRMRYKMFLQQRLDSIGKSEPVSYVGMLNDILTHEDIETLSIEGEKLIVQTNAISITFKDVDYYIGRFEIVIDKSNSNITMRNIDRVVNERHHPHVASSKTPCWGEAKESVSACFKNNNYFGLVLLSLCLLNSYNDDDKYQTITYWK